MINNRQGQSGRRRGRGGQRPQGMPGNSGGNARDNRQRGNAAQLLEKYKSMARDAQLSGDRVQTEYFLQFADHYFRVLEESRSRFEEQGNRRPRRDDEDDLDDGQDMVADGDSDGDDEDYEPRQQQQQQQQRRERPAPRERQETQPRAERPDRQPRTNGARRDQGYANDDQGIAMALPPSIGVSSDSEADESVEAVKPRRRVRKPRADDSGEGVAPAA